MYISLANSSRNCFRKWSDAQPPGNDDAKLGGPAAIALAVPPCDDPETVSEPPHRPWLVPGTRGSF